MLRTIGMMSGTSLDGVDAAWVETDGERIGRLGPRLTLPYDNGLRRDLRALLDRANAATAGNGLPPDDPLLLDCVRRLTIRHAEAAAAIGEGADLIGFHGQTILHRPARRGGGFTWQVGDAATLADLTGLPVAHDFRSADVAAGGQGAPLVPVFHAALAADLPKPLAVLNLGGVGNVTWIGLGDGNGGDPLVAFDTGPANGPLDDWVRRHTGAACDWDGALAASGRADPEVLARLLAHRFFALPPPKSLDRLEFSRALRDSGAADLPPADGAATLVAFCVGAVAAALAHLPAPPREWLVAGGGRRNAAVMRGLQATLPQPVRPVEAVGWDGDTLEAQAFGLLAARVARGLPLTFPGTTGAPRPLPGGRLIGRLR